MPLTVKVGLAKKIGQPDFGSLGASCDIELELDGGLLFNDWEGLQQKIQSAYIACRQAVNDELAARGQNEQPIRPDTAANAACQKISVGHHPRIASASGDQQTNHRSPPRAGKRRTATASQVRALHAIATRQGFDLTERLRQQFQVYRAEELSVNEASQLIDECNQVTGSVAADGAGGPHDRVH